MVRGLRVATSLIRAGNVGDTRTWATTDASLQESTNNAEVLTNVIPPTSDNSNLVRSPPITRRLTSTGAAVDYSGA